MCNCGGTTNILSLAPTPVEDLWMVDEPGLEPVVWLRPTTTATSVYGRQRHYLVPRNPGDGVRIKVTEADAAYFLALGYVRRPTDEDVAKWFAEHPTAAEVKDDDEAKQV